MFYSFLPAAARERLDPVGYWLCSLIGAEHFQNTYLFWQITAAALGFAMLLRRGGRPLALSIGCGAAAALSAPFIFGPDIFLLRAHYFPLLLASLTVFASTAATLAASGAAGALWIITAGTAGPAGLLLAAAAASLLRSSRGEALPRLTGLLLLLLFLASAALLPLPFVPQYPGSARLALDNVLSSLPPPYLGPSLEQVPAGFDPYQWAVRSHALRAAVVCLLAVASTFGSTRYRPLSAVLAVSLAVVLASAIEGIIPGEMLVYSPLQIVARLVPGFSLTVLPSVLLLPAATCFIAAVGWMQKRKTFEAALLLFAAVAAADAFGAGNLAGAAPLPPPARFIEATGSTPVRYSLSAAVVRYFGEWAADPEAPSRREFSKLKRLQRGADFNWAADASVQAGIAPLAIDGNSHSRWRTARPQQAGDWFKITFDRDVALLRVGLWIGPAPSDFPRGLKVYAIQPNGTEQLVADYSPWIGPIEWTSDGYPYFAEPWKVIIDLPQQTTLRGLRFESTGAAKYDWSIFEVKLFSLP